MSNPNDPIDREELKKLREKIQREIGDLTFEDLVERDPEAFSPEMRQRIVEFSVAIQKKFSK